jgi:hypothetical protein
VESFMRTSAIGESDSVAPVRLTVRPSVYLAASGR